MVSQTPWFAGHRSSWLLHLLHLTLMAYICGLYDKAAKTLQGLTFVVLVTEELKEGYVPGGVIAVGLREYILTNRRFIAAGTVVQYDLKVHKEK